MYGEDSEGFKRRLAENSIAMDSDGAKAGVDAESGEFEEVLTEEEYHGLLDRIDALKKIVNSKDEFEEEVESIREVLYEMDGVIRARRPSLKMDRFNQEQLIKNKEHRRIHPSSEPRDVGLLDESARAELADIKKEGQGGDKRRINILNSELEGTLNLLRGPLPRV